MSDIFILYIVVTYLFTLGMTIKSLIDGQDVSVYIGMVINLLFVPVVTPIIIGWVAYEKLN